MARRRTKIFPVISILIHLAIFSIAILIVSTKPALDYLSPHLSPPKEEDKTKWIKIDFTPLTETNKSTPLKEDSTLSWKDNKTKELIPQKRGERSEGKAGNISQKKTISKQGKRLPLQKTHIKIQNKKRNLTRKGKVTGETKPIPLNTRRFEYMAYFSKIRKRINSVWRYPGEALETGKNGDTTVQLYIKRDGSIAKVSIYSSSGVRILDEESIRAVLDASPFNPIPKEIEVDQLNIIATFGYHPRFVTE